MHKFVRKMAAAGIAAWLIAGQPLSAWAMAPILPLSEVAEGMQGTAWTVLDSSGAIQSFPVTIIGVLGEGKGADPMIMARAEGPLIHQVGGILQGMSGSPVYVHGRLVGAVAAGLKEMTPYTFFIRPIEGMTALWNLPDSKNKTRMRVFDLKKYLADKKKAEETAAKAKKDKSEKTDVMSAETEAKVDAELAKIKEKQNAPEKDTSEDASENASADHAKPAEDTGDSSGREAAQAAVPAEEVRVAPGVPAAGEAQQNEKEKKNDGEKTTLFVSGFNQAGVRFLNQQFDGQYNFLPMSGPTAAEQQEFLYNATLKPGQTVGAAMAYGDFAVGATGTVTAVDGKKIVAFGHPFLQRGNVNYFMTDATIIGTISGVSNGMKLGNIGSVLGRISQDRTTGIAGTLGDFPSCVPLRVKVHDNTLGRTDVYESRIAYDEGFLSQLSGGIVYSAISKTTDNLAEGTADVHFTIRTNAVPSGKVERSNMFYNTSDVGQIAVSEIMQALNIICANTEKESDILDVQADVTYDAERKSATILSAIPDKSKVKPGDTVTFTTTIKPYRRDKETLLIRYKVPENQPEGALQLDIRGGGLVPVTSLLLLQQSGVDVTNAESKQQTTAQKLEDLMHNGRNNEIIVAPSQTAAPLTEKQKKQALRRAQKAAEAAAKTKAGHKVDLLGEKKNVTKNTGETKFTTKYIIDNVVHATLQVQKK